MIRKSLLLSLVHLFVVLLFFSAGLFTILLPQLPLTKSSLIEIIEIKHEGLLLFGSILLGLGVLFSLCFFKASRGKFLVIKMGVQSDLKLIRHVVEDFFERNFAETVSLTSVEVGKKNHLTFQVSMKDHPDELYQKIEKGLSTLLKDRFGYLKPFYIVTKF